MSIHLPRWPPANRRSALAGVVLLAMISSGLARAAGPARWSQSAPPEVTAGRSLFLRVWTPDQGLGPAFNAGSCVACHAHPRAGGSGRDELSRVLIDPGTLDRTGGHVVRRFSTGGSRAQSGTGMTQRRRAPSLFGIGQLAAIPETVLLAAADPTDRDGDGISGRTGTGRFGWKARLPSLDHAVSAALLSELGLGTSIYPDDNAQPPVEVTPGQTSALVAYLRSLPLPGRLATRSTTTGSALFNRLRCSGCHRPAYTIDAPGRERHERIEPYTDLLLHDMGPALADGATEGAAGASEFRTPPLWRAAVTGPPYLHDGRAGSLDEAIRAHGGEGSLSASAYARLRPAERAQLLRFLEGL